MRIRIISGVISALFAVLISGLAYTQILKNNKYSTLSRTNRVRLIPIEGQRGRIFDRNGVLLVANRSCFDVVVIEQELENPARTMGRLGEILDMSPGDISKKIERRYTAPFAPITIKEDVEKEKALILEEEGFRLPGVMVRIVPKRDYKFKDIGSHIFGYLGEIDKGELNRLRDYGYQIRDLIGKDGIEKSYDTYLRGEEGGMQLEVNNRGYFVRSLGKKESSAGKDILITIDIRLQEFIENALEYKIGACIAMNPKTGEVLALVSKPNFDPSIFISRDNDYGRANILKDARRPMLNRAVSGQYPPGSVFKPVIAIAGLERRKFTPHTLFNCAGKYILGGSIFECWDDKGHGDLDVRGGLKHSCNVFFYQAGRATGVDDISGYAARFGYGAPAGIDLPEETPGLVPNRMWKRLARKEQWFEGDTLNFSIGQGYLLVSPLQVLRMTAAIANGGVLVQPYIVKRIDNVEIATARFRDTGVSKKTLEVIRSGLKSVVEDENGTGRRARAEGLSVAGKTGTAQNPKGPSHAWFTGFSPAEDPRIALVVFIEHGGKGGLEAAECAGKIFSEARRIGLL
ncbi:MAG: penicillin-binding protein 2 [Candidatus Omnitrophica bacterium]|nr:penicillin-binding protein 2 [Candidatus Omnitrophota bacterium]